MFRHCVMFKWVDDVSADAKAAVSAGLDELAELACVQSYHHGPDAGVSDGNWDYVAVGDFVSVDEYKIYATDEGHLTLIADLIKPNISARAAIQYDY